MAGLPAAIAAPIEGALAEVEAIVAAARRDCPGAVSEVLGGTWVGRGKRLRPALCIHASRAAGADPPGAPLLGSAVELLHLASLLHDDFIDGALTRRGEETAHVRFGPRWALLAGDFLFARALQLVLEAGGDAAVRVLTDGARAMIEGESLEVARAGDLALTPDEAIVIARKKTAALFSAGCRVGALAGGAPGDEVEALAAFGDSLGLAFQIADDVLDVRGSREATGKDPGTDLREGNLTLPLALALEDLDADARARFSAVFGRKDALDHEVAASLAAVCATIGVDRALATARRHAAAAAGALERVRRADVRAALAACLDLAVARDS